MDASATTRAAPCLESGCGCPACAALARNYALSHWRGVLSWRAVVEAARLRRAGLRPSADNLALALADWLSRERPNPLADKRRYSADVDPVIRLVAREAASEER